ncbi:MAG: hypothetical protein C0606_11345 [Hyphomicrobiales bacterium]|nr:MAG: hypothetical protein C0606_11345 [Hyphomicrobiales bacterium]
MRILEDAKALSRDNRVATLVYLVKSLGIEELFRAYIMQEYGKDTIFDLADAEVDMACSYVEGISNLIQSAGGGRVQ